MVLDLQHRQARFLEPIYAADFCTCNEPNMAKCLLETGGVEDIIKSSQVKLPLIKTSDNRTSITCKYLKHLI